MSGVEPMHAARAAELRRAFDRAFAEPVAAAARETMDFVSIRLAGEAHALRMTEIAGVFADVGIAPCPSPLPELLGIAGFRGVLTPVYDLAALLGHGTSSGRWLVLVRGAQLALGFDDFDGHFRVEPAALAARHGPSQSAHVHRIARIDDNVFSVIDIASVLATITARASAASSHKEH